MMIGLQVRRVGHEYAAAIGAPIGAVAAGKRAE